MLPQEFELFGGEKSTDDFFVQEKLYLIEKFEPRVRILGELSIILWLSFQPVYMEVSLDQIIFTELFR